MYFIWIKFKFTGLRLVVACAWSHNSRIWIVDKVNWCKWFSECEVQSGCTIGSVNRFFFYFFFVEPMYYTKWICSDFRCVKYEHEKCKWTQTFDGCCRTSSFRSHLYHKSPNNLPNVWIILNRFAFECLNMHTMKLYAFNCRHCQWFLQFWCGSMNEVDADNMRHMPFLA